MREVKVRTEVRSKKEPGVVNAISYPKAQTNQSKPSQQPASPGQQNAQLFLFSVCGFELLLHLGGFEGKLNRSGVKSPAT